MKTVVIAVLIMLTRLPALAQADELAQLALNIEKLAQFKQILTDLKKAYEVLNGGYTTIKNISEGNFNLHKAFLDGLLSVSPAVQKYYRVQAIIRMQIQLIKEYRSAKQQFSSMLEFAYISKTYDKLINGSLRDLTALADIITANKLRMSDDERIHAIDQVFNHMQEKLVFLRHFSSSTAILQLQREKEQEDIDLIKKTYRLP